MDNVFNDITIVKRSGQRVSFNGNKIAVAIKNAFDNVYSETPISDVNKVYSNVLSYIETNYSDRKTINVEDIQDIIENTLKKFEYHDVYIAFTSYRAKRALSRDIFDRKKNHKFVKITEKIASTLENNDSSTSKELITNFSKTISNQFSKSYLIDNKYIRSHDEGAIYIQSFDHYLYGMIGNLDIDLNSINDFEYYFDTIINTLHNIKKECYGEVHISNIDELFIPYTIYKFKEIFINNLSLFLDLEGFSEYINFKSIKDIILKQNDINIDLSIFDKYISNDRLRSILIKAYESSLNELYKDLKYNIKKLLISLNSSESLFNNIYSISLGIGLDIIRNSYFDVLSSIDYLPNVVTIIKITKNLDINNLYKKNIAFENINYEHFSDGSVIADNIYEKNSSSIGRFVIASTTINMARIALKSNSLDEFYHNLSNTLELTKNELLNEFDYISNNSKSNYNYLFSNNYLIDSDKLESNHKIKKVIRNGILNIEYACIDEASKMIKEDKNKILDFMNSKIKNYIYDSKVNFNLKYTTNYNILKYFNELDKTIYSTKIGEYKLNIPDIVHIDSIDSLLKEINKILNNKKGFVRIENNGI